jgi:hypothetical protein
MVVLQLKCKLGCGQLVRAAHQPIHAAKECVLRPVKCKFDCGVRLAARAIGQHEASGKLRLPVFKFKLCWPSGLSTIALGLCRQNAK